MEIDVEIRVAKDGTITPLRFLWGGTWQPIAQIGRAWSDGMGDHWLIMLAGPAQVFELTRGIDGVWRVAPTEPPVA